MSEKTETYLKQLPLFLIFNNIRLVHGTPPDLYRKYIDELDNFELQDIFKIFPEHITFCGHTHKDLIVIFDGFEIIRIENVKYNHSYNIDDSKRYIINPGSISSINKLIKFSSFVIYDDTINEIIFLKF